MVLGDGILTIHELDVGGSAYACAAAAAERGIGGVTTVQHMLEIGGTLLQHGSAQATVDSVNAEVDRLIEVVTTTAAEALPEAMKSHVDAIGEIVGKHFDGARKDSVQGQLLKIFDDAARKHSVELTRSLLDDASPLGTLRSDMATRFAGMADRQDALLKEIATLKERLALVNTLAAERDRGAAKGVDYESVVGVVVEWIHAPHEDMVLDVGTESGVDGNKCGDHLVVLNTEDTRGHDRRVVFESKCRALGLRAALRELDRAMANREAEAGVMVFASHDHAPMKGRSLRVYPGNRILVVFDREDENSLALEAAAQIARTAALATVGSDDDESVDVETIAEELNRLTEVLEEARAIKKGVNAARRGIDQADAGYEQMRESALAVVADITKALTK